VTCEYILTGSLWRLVCKRRPPLFPLYTAPVIRCVFTSASTALRLLPRDGAPTGKLGTPIRDAPCRVSAFTLLVSEALAVLALQWALWTHVRLHRHSQAAEFGV